MSLVGGIQLKLKIMKLKKRQKKIKKVKKSKIDSILPPYREDNWEGVNPHIK